MGALRRKRGTPSGYLIVFVLVPTVVFFLDSCRLHRRITFPDCSLEYYELLQPQPQHQWASQSLTENRLTGPSLASQQSYGFFNDIPDESWRLMQRRARTSLHLKGQALPEIFHSSNHENPNVVSSYLNNLQVSVVLQYSECIVKGERPVTSKLI
jgi:hypothetical protein